MTGPQLKRYNPNVPKCTWGVCACMCMWVTVWGKGILNLISSLRLPLVMGERAPRSLSRFRLKTRCSLFQSRSMHGGVDLQMSSHGHKQFIKLSDSLVKMGLKGFGGNPSVCDTRPDIPCCYGQSWKDRALICQCRRPGWPSPGQLFGHGLQEKILQILKVTRDGVHFHVNPGQGVESIAFQEDAKWPRRTAGQPSILSIKAPLPGLIRQKSLLALVSLILMCMLFKRRHSQKKMSVYRGPTT